MIDEIFDRTYQSGRAELNAGIDRAIKRIAKSAGAAFDALYRIQFAAPWNKRSSDTRCA